MIYMFDSDTANYAVKGVGDVMDRYGAEAVRGSRFALSPMVAYEVTRFFTLRGMRQYQRSFEAFTRRWIRVSVGDETWRLATDLWVERHRAGRPIADADLLIAVTAFQTGAVLVTNNTRHFEGLGVTLENWIAG